MYFPYLRGRQFELIVLREMIENSMLSESIVPIIEPVTLSSTLFSTLQAFVSQGKNVIVIRNPQVGKFLADLSIESNKERHAQYHELLQNEFVIEGHIMNPSSETEIKSLQSNGNLSVIMNNIDHLGMYDTIFAENNPQYTFVPYEAAFRRRLRTRGALVLHMDRFPKMVRNKDYAISIDNNFSSDHLYFREEGYTGFSDYSIVGDEYSTSGFLPHAVVIHMVYFDSQNELRIHHYVSDSNDDYEDPAGKFTEALQKLINCPHFNNCDTLAMQQFREHYQNGTYPGLGVVKKLSMMHHFEIMGEFLDEAEEI